MLSKSRFAVLGFICLLVILPCAVAQEKDGTSVNPVGSWYGSATLGDTTIVMMPTFFSDGSVIANDDHEGLYDHGTSHGTWVRTGAHSIKATFIWFQFTPFGGVFPEVKVVLTGNIDPHNQNAMTGELQVLGILVSGTAVDDPGISLGVATIKKLQRIR